MMSPKIDDEVISVMDIVTNLPFTLPTSLLHETPDILKATHKLALLEANSSEHFIKDGSGLTENIINETTLLENATLAYNNSVELTTANNSSEMYPQMDENVGNYIALGFFFAFVIAVIILISVVIYCCLKRRKKLILEKSITKIENPKYSSQPSKYPQSFDFLSSQNARAEFHNGRGESSSAALMASGGRRSPHVTISIDEPSSGTSLYSSESNNRAEYKRLSRTSDYPAASLVSIGNGSEASVPAATVVGNDPLGPSTDGRSSAAGKRGVVHEEHPTNGKNAVAVSPEYAADETTENSETLSWPLLGGTKNFGSRTLKSKASEVEARDEDDEEEDDESATNQSTSLLKSKGQSMTSLDSYDPSLNPFLN